jgi:starch-binding outer membrane protein, SusD/RagB family
MKRYIITIAAALALSSCSKILEKPDPTAVDPTIVWRDEATANLYLNELYFRSLPLNGFGLNAGTTEETPTTSVTSTEGRLVYGTVGVDDVGTFALTAYTRIRNINIGLEEIQASPTLDQAAKDRLTGQLYFMRAWEYFTLVRQHGGVPLLLRSVDPFNEEFTVPRNKTSECFDAIVADLDKAIATLPPTRTEAERGRVTKVAAAAFKGRVLLYWASPQYNVNDDAARWQRAYQANLAAKTIATTEGNRDLYSSFANIFLVESPTTNREIIFTRPFDFTAGVTNAWENTARPREFGQNGGSINPTVELMEAFPNADGTPFVKPASYAGNNVFFFRNRDPRFYATIAYNGSDYPLTGLNAAATASTTNPRGNRQWNYQYYATATSTAVTQLETNPTTTGFYTKKMINPATAQTLVAQSGTDWIEIRYAEVLMNLAECANEIGNLQEAKDQIGLIRRRAGIPAGANNYGQTANDKNTMRALIMNERLVEFAYEDKRYWDIRRRNLYAQDLPGTTGTRLNGTRRTGLIFTLRPQYRNADFIRIRESINLDTDFYTYFTVSERQNRDANPIAYRQPANPGPGNPSYNFFGIQTSLINRSPGLLQTQGWANSNTFNPFE